MTQLRKDQILFAAGMMIGCAIGSFTIIVRCGLWDSYVQSWYELLTR